LYTVSGLNYFIHQSLTHPKFSSLDLVSVITKSENAIQVDYNKEKNPIPKIPTKKFNELVDECFNRFCTAEAREEAAERTSAKLHNFLLRLQEFSTVVEANQAMKDGDVGRLLNVWRLWSIMSQSLKGLKNYSSYLPRMVLLLTQFLPPSLSKLFRHSLLISPSGREGHFVAKDFYLEINNYWLKFFYNRSGIGTRVDRLKNLFSLNIPLVCLLNGFIHHRLVQNHRYNLGWLITYTLEFFISCEQCYIPSERTVVPMYSHSLTKCIFQPNQSTHSFDLLGTVTFLIKLMTKLREVRRKSKIRLY
jgi:hypothetical protein